MPKVENICGKGRSYQGRDGKTHYNWVQAGRLITQDDGNKFIVFEKHINPLGFANEKGEVILSVFEPKAKESTDIPF